MAQVRESLEQFAAKIAAARNARPGTIVFRLSGEGGGTFQLSGAGGDGHVVEAMVVDAQPLVEVIGDAATVRAVLDGEVDAREQFLSGGIRVRGDLRHVSNVALELGLLKRPL